jgi:hypothetical protein
MGKTKGSAVLGAVKLLRARKIEAAALLPAALRRYLEERVVVASWYPEEDLIGLIVTCATLLQVPGDRVFETMGALSARSHLEGVYADLLHRGPATRARTLWKTQHDTGVLSVTSETPTSVTYELVGWDHGSAEYCRLLGGYFAEVHRLAGAASPTFLHPTCRSARAASCTWVVRWEPANPE